jgi:alpha-glucosidase
MRLLHERLVCIGQSKLYVNVHDAYRPRGFTRTMPHLLTQEGIRGEERKPDGDHHILLAVVRYLIGICISSIFIHILMTG